MTGKISVQLLLAELANAAGIGENQVTGGQLNTLQGSKSRGYDTGHTYGKPVDCSGLLVAIARKHYDPYYPRYTADTFNSEMGEKDIHIKDGKVDLPDIPGIFVYRPRDTNRTESQSQHVGIYTGRTYDEEKDEYDLYTIEAFDPKHGIGRRGDRLTGKTMFTRWGYLDFVDYPNRD